MASSRTAALFEAVYADLSDDGPRLVLADALQEAADPLGEFIALQVRRTKTHGRPSARERALLAEHSARWLGPLAPALKSVRFDRGFPVSADVTKPVTTPDAPQWSTFLSLRLKGRRVTAEFLLSAALRGLERVLGLDWAQLEALLATRPAIPWATLELVGWNGVAVTPLLGLRSLRSLTLRGAEAHPYAVPRLLQLEALEHLELAVRQVVPSLALAARSPLNSFTAATRDAVWLLQPRDRQLEVTLLTQSSRALQALRRTAQDLSLPVERVSVKCSTTRESMTTFLAAPRRTPATATSALLDALDHVIGRVAREP